MLIASSITLESLRGVVGLRWIIKSGLYDVSLNTPITCWKNSKSVELSSEIFLGLRKGTSAPYSIDISLYSSESVETITQSILLAFRAALMLQAINGCPPRL